MHSFHIPFKIQKSLFQIKHGDNLLFLGRCFSDEISEKAKFNGFDVTVDPFGTIFHPEVIARNISESIQVKTSVTRIIQRNDLFFSWIIFKSIWSLESGLTGAGWGDVFSWYEIF